MPCGYIGEFRNWKFENKNAFDGRNDYRPPEIIPRRIRIENLRNLLDTGAAFALLSASAKLGRHSFTGQRRIPSTMSNPLELEFVLVSSDYATMTAVLGGVKKYGAKFILAPTMEAARDCLNRRKIDGVFVDLEVAGALGVIEGIRKGTSNSKAVIFACVMSSREYTETLSAGANFLLRKPLNEDSVALHITIAKELLERERRRYFRHSVSLPVILKDSGAEQHARMTNLSEGGMAARTVTALRHSAVIDYEFALSSGANICGKGQVAWVNTEGLAGILVQTFRGMGKERLAAWLTAQEELAVKKDAPDR